MQNLLPILRKVLTDYPQAKLQPNGNQIRLRNTKIVTGHYNGKWYIMHGNLTAKSEEAVRLSGIEEIDFDKELRNLLDTCQ